MSREDRKHSDASRDPYFQLGYYSLVLTSCLQAEVHVNSKQVFDPPLGKYYRV